jgi:eukaryotic-like serine/threonine-protein kinase
LTATRQGLGTPWYTAPEQWSSAREVNHLSDIFSLGRVLQELVTGERGTEIPPGHLRPVIQKATANRPSDRHQNVDEFFRDLERAVGAATHGKWETVDDAAGRLLSRVRQTRAAPSDLDDFVNWALTLDETVSDDMAALTRVLPWLSASSIRYVWTSKPSALRQIFEHHSTYVANSRFEFAFCDVLADFARRAVNETRDPQVLRYAIRSLTTLGCNHNRWHVRDVLIALLQQVRATESILAAIDGLNDAGETAVEWNISDFSLEELVSHSAE